MQPIWRLNRPAVVMDCGTGYSKLGFAGNAEPSFVIPTVLGPPAPYSATAGLGATRGAGSLLSDLDFTIGEDALAAAQLTAPSTLSGGAAGGVGVGGGLPGTPGGSSAATAAGAAAGGLVFPVRQGVVTDWDAMERFWQKSLFHFLRVDPEEHPVVVTEPPLNPPEGREALAEIMFESFNVGGLYVGVQAVLALYAGWASADKAEKAAAMGTQTEGGVPRSATPHTKPPSHPPFTTVPSPSPSISTTADVSASPASDFAASPSPAALTSPSAHLTGTVVDVGDGVAHIIPVVEGFVLEGAIKSLPLAGRAVTGFVQQMLRDRGEPVPPDLSSEVSRRLKEAHCYVAPDMLREFGRYDREPAKYHRVIKLLNPKTGTDFSVELGYERFLGPEVFFNPGICPTAPPGTPSLPRAVDDVIQACPVDTRRSLYGNVVLSGGSTMFKNFARRLTADLTAATSRRLLSGAKAIDINVRSHAMQRYAVWFGGSLLACDPRFPSVCHTREQYQEYGPSICRSNFVFRDGD